MTHPERKLTLMEDIMRLRRAQLESPENRDIAAVRARLEDELGGTVSRRTAAKVLGVSHTALQRWIAKGDLPTVITQSGRSEVPVSVILSLAESIDDQKETSTRRLHFIEQSMITNRERAARLSRRPVWDDQRTANTDLHNRAANRALAFHRAVARRLDRQLVNDARRTVWKLRDAGKLHPRYAVQWEAVLDGDIREIKRRIVSDDQLGRDLRQNSPFAGALSEAERNEVFQQVRA